MRERERERVCSVQNYAFKTTKTHSFLFLYLLLFSCLLPLNLYGVQIATVLYNKVSLAVFLPLSQLDSEALLQFPQFFFGLFLLQLVLQESPTSTEETLGVTILGLKKTTNKSFSVKPGSQYEAGASVTLQWNILLL